jgi:hypothetical protein
MRANLHHITSEGVEELVRRDRTAGIGRASLHRARPQQGFGNLNLIISAARR